MRKVTDDEIDMNDDDQPVLNLLHDRRAVCVMDGDDFLAHMYDEEATDPIEIMAMTDMRNAYIKADVSFKAALAAPPPAQQKQRAAKDGPAPPPVPPDPRGPPPAPPLGIVVHTASGVHGRRLGHVQHADDPRERQRGRQQQRGVVRNSSSH